MADGLNAGRGEAAPADRASPDAAPADVTNPDAAPADVTNPDAAPQIKRRTAALSVVSNSTLILLKVIAGTVTGSVAILTEAIHSSIDLVASIVAYFSVRKAGEPADESHRYGHEKIENLAAAIEGILILVGSAAIAFESIRRLIKGGQVQMLGLGIAVVGLSIVVNVVVSAVLARNARLTGSPALEADAAHLRTDAMTSSGVLLALVLVKVTGANWIDPVVALMVAAAIVVTGVRLLTRSSQVLVDQSLPQPEIEAIRGAIEAFAPRGVVGYHELRTRRAGSRRYVDLHVQFRAGTSLEDAHRTAHELQDLIAARLDGADVLIHLEPEDRVRPGEVLTTSSGPRGRSA
jgi:cation diffusion facilitator family transporter